MDLQPVKDFFEDEIDAFAGTATDLYNLATGKPVHTDAQKWAKRIITAATTVVPVGLSVKAAVKSAKIAGNTVKAASRLDKAKKAQDLNRAQQLQKERERIRAANAVIKPVAKSTRRISNIAYYVTGDSEARSTRNANLRKLPADLEDSKMAYMSAKKKKRMIKGAVAQTTKALKSRKDKPITSDDAKVILQNAAYGALKNYSKSKGALSKAKGMLHNDKKWYTVLGTDMVGLNFSHPDKLGAEPNLLKDEQGRAVPIQVSTDAVIDLLLTVPSGCQDPFTIAAAKLGQEMRLHSGANTIYTPEDIQEYLINARSLMAGLCQAIRATKCLNQVDSLDVDAYAKYAMMAIEAFEPTRDTRYPELVENGANILTRVNSLIKQTRMMIPINMPIMKRTEWLFSNFFADGEQQKYSTKMFGAATLPKAVYSTPGVSGGVITVTMEDFMVSQSPLAALKYLEQRFAAFVTDRIHMAIAGDVMKIYGIKAFWSPDLLSGVEPPNIIYDEEALTQMQNMTVLSTPTVDISNFAQTVQNGVVQTTGDVRHTLDTIVNNMTTARGLHYSSYFNKVAQTYKREIDGGDILELSRLMATIGEEIDPNDNTHYTITELICGSEVAINYGYVNERVLTAGGQYLSLTEMHRFGTSWDVHDKFFAHWAIDDWAPLLPFGYNAGTGELSALFDFQNWASVSNEQLRSYHYIANLSMMTVTDPVLKPTI